MMCRPEMVVGWYHSHPGFGCWLSGVDINTQQVRLHPWPFHAPALLPQPSIKHTRVLATFPAVSICANVDEGHVRLHQCECTCFLSSELHLFLYAELRGTESESSGCGGGPHPVREGQSGHRCVQVWDCKAVPFCHVSARSITAFAVPADPGGNFLSLRHSYQMHRLMH